MVFSRNGLSALVLFLTGLYRICEDLSTGLTAESAKDAEDEGGRLSDRINRMDKILRGVPFGGEFLGDENA
jgi:hypothetical protein